MKIINLGGSCPICGVGTLTHYNSNNVTALICSDIQSEEVTIRGCSRVFNSRMIGQNIPEISILGAKNTSKTNYIYSLLNELYNDAKFHSSFGIDTVLSGYEGDEAVLEMNCNKLLHGEFIEASEKGTIVHNYYVVKSNSSKQILIRFQDSAGEAFSRDLTSLDREYPNAASSEGLIIMLDPTYFPNLKKDKNSVTIEYTDNKIVVDMLHDLLYSKLMKTPAVSIPRREGRGRFVPFGPKFAPPRQEEYKINLPIAFCVAKFDLLSELSPTYFASNDYFDDRAQFLMKNYEEISESLEHTISLLDPELIKKIKSKFSNYNFFPIHLAKPKVGTNGRNFDASDSGNFRGVLAPLIWMLHKLNYLG